MEEQLPSHQGDASTQSIIPNLAMDAMKLQSRPGANRTFSKVAEPAGRLLAPSDIGRQG
jgi:hypothetical protein